MPAEIEDKLRALEELEENLGHHLTWAERLNRSFACRIPADPEVTSKNAHCECRLGQWLLGRGKEYFGHSPRFKIITAAHEATHDKAREMATSLKEGKTIQPEHYDAFLESLKTLQSEIRATHGELSALINSADPLTGAENRISMRARLEERIRACGDSPTHSWFVMMDLDHFKKVNDTYGHPTGDAVLAGVAATVRANIRSNDLFFRYGGEEFLICIDRVDETRIAEIADRLRLSIAQRKFTGPGGQSFTVTASFGVLQLVRGISMSEALNRADSALYQAKDDGRNCVRFDQNNPVPA